MYSNPLYVRVYYKTPRNIHEDLKLQIVPNPKYTMLFPIYSFLS